MSISRAVDDDVMIQYRAATIVGSCIYNYPGLRKVPPGMKPHQLFPVIWGMEVATYEDRMAQADEAEAEFLAEVEKTRLAKAAKAKAIAEEQNNGGTG